MAEVGVNSSDMCSLVFPWIASLLLGVLTALTGSFVAINGDFLCDLRFGFCRGLVFADRMRCCGGSDNVNFHTDRCLGTPSIVHDLHVDGGTIAVEWIPWDEYFGEDMHFFSLLLYFLPGLAWSAIAAFLVLQYSDEARGSGIPEVKATVSGYDLQHSFSPTCLLVKALALSFVVGAGLSLGKEGALIHIGVCWAHLFHSAATRLSDIFGAPVPLHEITCAGGAAGVSAAFGAPLGGVLYALEGLGSVREMSSRTLLLSFFAAFSASVMLKLLNLTGANHLTFFSLTLPTMHPRNEWLSWEMVFFFLIGIIGGVVGALFVILNLWITQARHHGQRCKLLWMFPKDFQMYFFKLWGCYRIDNNGEHVDISFWVVGVMEAIVIALVTAILNLCFTTLLRTGPIEAIHALFETCPSLRASHFGLCEVHAPHLPNLSSSLSISLFLAATTRIFQTSYTFGAAVPAGLFIPSLFIGAVVGRSMGHLLAYLTEHHVDNLSTHIEPGVFAMVGAAAMLAGFCRLTFTIVVIMLELTGELSYVVPFMCAVLTAKLVGDVFTSSVFDAHAKFNGYDTTPSMDAHVGLHVGDVAAVILPEDCFDEAKPVSLQSLARQCTRKNGNEDGSERVEEYRSGRDSEVLLVLRGSKVEEGSSAVVGILDCLSLQHWILEQDLSNKRYCTFRESGPHTSGIFGMGVYAAAQIVADQDAYEVDALQAEVLDASGLVDKNIRCISSVAPLLTAMSTFDQHPEVRYCVCIDVRRPAAYRVFSRRACNDILLSNRFPLVHTPASSVMDMAPSQRRSSRSVGAVAVLAMCARAWRHYVCNRFSTDHIGSPLIPDRHPSPSETEVRELSALDVFG